MTSPRPTAVTCWLLLAAAGLMVLPAEMQATVRLAMGDLLRPGCAAWRATRHEVRELQARWRTAPSSGNDDVSRLQEELALAQRHNRQLELQLAGLEEISPAATPPLFNSASESPGERLAQPVLVTAAVMGESSSKAFRSGRWLDQGTLAGLVDEAVILKSEQPLIDIGRDVRLSPEDKLLIGRSVVGKVQHVGRWSSTFLLVNDAEYRGRAQLVRKSTAGYVFGAKGIWRGTGEETCRLEGIPAAETVEVGDSVYTADRDGILPTPLYYGTVVAATLEDRAKTWQIFVRPVDRPHDLTHVEVLRTGINTRRALAN